MRFDFTPSMFIEGKKQFSVSSVPRKPFIYSFCTSETFYYLLCLFLYLGNLGKHDGDEDEEDA